MFLRGDKVRCVYKVTRSSSLIRGQTYTIRSLPNPWTVTLVELPGRSFAINQFSIINRPKGRLKFGFKDFIQKVSKL